MYLRVYFTHSSVCFVWDVMTFLPLYEIKYIIMVY